jgi:glutamyl-tRNA reductase
MSLLAIGLSHKTAPLEIRERLAFAPREIGVALTALRAIPGVQECLLLSTCNRTEAYLAGDSRLSPDQVTAALAEAKGIHRDEVRPWLMMVTDTDAARHVLRVASGLESMVVGEAQILSQVRQALEMAHAVGATGSILTRLLQVAIATGRRVRRETGLSTRAPSVPRAALELCQRAVGPLHGRRLVVIGAGEIGALVVKVFSAAGAQITAVANRSLGPARLLAARVGATAITLEDLPAALHDAEVVVVTVGASSPVLSASDLSGRTTALYVSDLGVPRGVDPAVAGLPGIHLENLDALGSGALSVVPDTVVRDAERIVDDALAAFCRWLQARSVAPLIAALHRRAEQIADEELARARLSGLDPRQRDAVRATVQAALGRLLHTPIVRLKAAAGRGQPAALVADLFDLDGTAEQDNR